MQKLLSGALALLIIVALGGYGVWTLQRPEGHYLSDLRIELALNQGQPSGRGNLLGVEPLLFPGDYQNLTRLQRKLSAYLEQARAHGLINPRTVVVLPEHIGTWLWARGEKNELYQATHRREAWQWLELSNPLRYGLAMLNATGEDRRSDAHLRMKAEQMAQDYQRVFGTLAKDFGVTLVAGSIILPAPYIAQGQLHAGDGPLYNSSLVFASDGSLLGPPQGQRYPDSELRRFVAPARQPPQVLDTPAGRLGVLVGSDSWYPGNYQALREQSVGLIANPVFLSGKDAWQQPWRGNRHQPAAQALPLQRGQLSEQAAWQQLTQAGTAAGATSISVFMRGQFWEQAADGQGFFNQAQRPLTGTAHAGARLLNLWL